MVSRYIPHSIRVKRLVSPSRGIVSTTGGRLRFVESESITAEGSAKISRGRIITSRPFQYFNRALYASANFLNVHAKRVKARREKRRQRSGREPLNSECNSIIDGILRTFAIPARQSKTVPLSFSLLWSSEKSRIRGNNKRIGETEGEGYRRSYSVERLLIENLFIFYNLCSNSLGNKIYFRPGYKNLLSSREFFTFGFEGVKTGKERCRYIIPTTLARG